jgi:CheY-like chemotaxis protein
MIALIADDSPTQRALWMYAFSSSGMTLRTVEEAPEIKKLHTNSARLSLDVVLARDGVDAAYFLEQLPVNVLVTDVDMPGMDGWKLAARAQALQPDLEMIVISSRVKSGDKPPPELDPRHMHVIAKSDREQAVHLVRRILGLNLA